MDIWKLISRKLSPTHSAMTNRHTGGCLRSSQSVCSIRRKSISEPWMENPRGHFEYSCLNAEVAATRAGVDQSLVDGCSIRARRRHKSCAVWVAFASFAVAFVAALIPLTILLNWFHPRFVFSTPHLPSNPIRLCTTQQRYSCPSRTFFSSLARSFVVASRKSLLN